MPTFSVKMPIKTTYGKRKKSILSLLPVHGEEGKFLQSPRTKAEKRVSATISMTAFYGKKSNDSNRENTLAFDDSIGEIPSMILDNTTMNQLTRESGKRLSKLRLAKTLQQTSGQGSFHEKILPRLPRLSFDSEDDWTTGSRRIITPADGILNGLDLSNDDDELDSCPPPVSRQPFHARKSSIPPLPRKSSKRGSRPREQRDMFNSQNPDEGRHAESRKLSKLIPQTLQDLHTSSVESTKLVVSTISPDVSQQIEAMFAASKTLKPEKSSLTIDSPILSKRSSLKGNRVLSRMKNAINIHLHDKAIRNHLNETKKEHLLNPTLNQIPDYDEDVSTISAMELRINEGVNFANPKIQSLTGHGTIRRKPIADDGRSLMSRKSVEILSIEGVRTVETKTFKSLESRRQREVSFDLSADMISSLPGSSYRFKDEPRQIEGEKNAGHGFDVDFDALFSSSPVAQSTPRIRLEPTFEESGVKKLRNVPADSRSVFDPDSSMREPLTDLDINRTSPKKKTSKKMIVKRNNSQVKDVGLGVTSHMSKKRKKHPQPSKADLQGFEENLAHYSTHVVSIDANKQEELALSFGELRTGDVLLLKDNNAPLSQAAKRSTKGNRLGLFSKAKPAVAGSSLADPARRPVLKGLKSSMIPKPAGAPTMKRRTDTCSFHRLCQTDESIMDTDELQWDLTAYHIGMRG